MMDERPKCKRGFASMSPEKRRAIASRGGVSAHAKGTAHEFTKAEASEAGKLGGNTIKDRPGHMAKIGRAGGLARRAARERAAEAPTDGK